MMRMSVKRSQSLNLAGPLRVIGDPRTHAPLVKRGDVVVVDMPRWDVATAKVLADRKPAVVLNAAAPRVHNGMSAGVDVLERAGVVVLGVQDRSILALEDSTRVYVSGQEGDITVHAQGFETAAAPIDLSEQEQPQGFGLAHTLAVAEAFDVIALNDADLDVSAAIEAWGERLRGADVAVFSSGAGAHSEAKVLRTAAKDLKMTVIAAGDAAVSASVIKRVDIIVGMTDSVPDDILAKAHGVVLLEVPSAATVSRLSAANTAYVVCESRLDPADLGIVIAARGGAATVVTVGTGAASEDVTAGTYPAGSLAARVLAGSRLVDAMVFGRLYRSRVSRSLAWGWWLLAASAVGAVVWFYPVTHDAVAGLIPDSWLQ